MPNAMCIYNYDTFMLPVKGFNVSTGKAELRPPVIQTLFYMLCEETLQM